MAVPLDRLLCCRGLKTKIDYKWSYKSIAEQINRNVLAFQIRIQFRCKVEAQENKMMVLMMLLKVIIG